jgi:hypothetical protein
LPDGGACQEQIRDIRARDQKDAANRTEENVKTARDIADEILTQRRGSGTEIGI